MSVVEYLVLLEVMNTSLRKADKQIRCCYVRFSDTVIVCWLLLQHLCPVICFCTAILCMFSPAFSHEHNLFHLNFLSHFFICFLYLDDLMEGLILCHSPNFLSIAFVFLAPSKLPYNQRPHAAAFISLFDC